MAEKGWKEKRKNISFENANGDKVRDTNLTKTFNMEISKESLEAIFIKNAKEQEVDDYCEAVAKEIEVPNKKSGGKKSIRERLQENKALVAEREKHREDSKKEIRGQVL